MSYDIKKTIGRDNIKTSYSYIPIKMYFFRLEKTNKNSHNCYLLKNYNILKIMYNVLSNIIQTFSLKLSSKKSLYTFFKSNFFINENENII